MKYHVIYKQQGVIRNAEMEAESVEDLEHELKQKRPKITKITVGIPLVEFNVETEATCKTCGKEGGKRVTFSTGTGVVTQWTRFVCPHCIARHEKALKEIAQFDDKGADDHLKRTGSYGSFDEPGSVQIARDALAEVCHSLKATE